MVWDGINGGDIAAVTMQDAEPVDDVVVTLRGELQAKVFISAKHRAGTIAMTANSPAFTDVIASFVQQFLKLAPPVREESRLMWAVPSSAGAGVTQSLLKVLNAFRADASANFADFLGRRQIREREAMEALLAQTKRAWKSATRKMPTQSELQDFLRMVHVEVFDFGGGRRHERTTEGIIRSLVAAKPAESGRIWEKLELHFNRADRQGLRTTAASLRRMLTAEGLKLKTPASFADDVELLQKLTIRNLERLKDHTLLQFATADIHIDRTEELSAMIAAANRGHFLVTGEPGCGKSGLIHPLAEALINDEIPVVVLLAEEVFGRDWKGAANLPGLAHALDEVLANWPNGKEGVFITDALDAVRDVETQRTLRRILRDVQQGTAGWTLVASVREFDLKHGRELREAFPGGGVAGHSSSEFTGVAHFHVTGFDETKLDELVAQVPDIGPFIANARKNLRAGGIHRSPFFLRLAAELLRDGVSPASLADWSSPVVLLRKIWERRVGDGEGTSQREVALQTICSRMVELRASTLSMQEVSLGVSERDAVMDLRSRGILQSPIIRHGSRIGDDVLRFCHDLLQEYAITRSVFPSTSARLSAFAARNPLLLIFYRQSFRYALEELWSGAEGRAAFWETTFKLQTVADLHGISQLLPLLVAAKRVEEVADVEPLLAALRTATSDDSQAHKVLRYMASGLQDLEAEAIRAGSRTWCLFTASLSQLLSGRPSLETPIVHILARLNTVSGSFDIGELRELNLAAGGVLAHHVAKEVSKGWRYAARTAIETLCRTFSAAHAESEVSLLSMLTPQRLANFPQWDLFDFANQIKHLGSAGDTVVVRLFEAAFFAEPTSGEWEDFGGAIMPMRMQRSDNWNSVHYSLAEYYQKRPGTNAGLMTDIACIAWNAAVRRRGKRREAGENVMAEFRFRGVQCDLVEDYGHIGGVTTNMRRIASSPGSRHYWMNGRPQVTPSDCASLWITLQHEAGPR